MPTILARTLLPLSVLVSLAAFHWVLQTGGDPERVVLLSGVAVFGLALAMEYRWPLRPHWNRSQGDLATDITSAAVLLGLVEPLLKVLLPWLITLLYGVFETRFDAFPTHWPFWLQVAAAALIAEFFFYWMHRWHHTLRPLWWLHALHHGSGRLYTLNNFRFHPLNHILNYGIGLFPLMLLGTPPTVILGYLALVQPVIILQHANLNLRSGWFNYVFSTNEVHRWHHSTERNEANSNYGRGLIIWDHLFGTFRYTPDRNMPEHVGLFSNSRYPVSAGYLQQVISVFKPGCCSAGH